MLKAYGRQCADRAAWEAGLALVKLITDCATVLLAEETQHESQALKSLLGPKPKPVPLEQLADFLKDHSNRKLPVSRSVYKELVAVEHDFEELVCPATGPVAAYMAGLIRNVRGSSSIWQLNCGNCR